MTGPTTTIYLLRHGATAINREVPYRLLGRKLDPSLDEVGRDQARRAGRALFGRPIAAVYSSPLRRALETARAVAEPHEVTPVVVPDLAEADLGRWEGLTWAQAAEHEPEHHAAFLLDPGNVPYPGGESFADAGRRFAPAIAAIVAGHPGREVAVVAHNVTNRAFLGGLLGLPIAKARAIRLANGGISVVIDQGGTLVVETLNARLHLDE